MISTSFGVYLTSGTTYPKLTQNGHCLDRKAWIRPTGILSMESWHEIFPVSSRGRNQTIQWDEPQNVQVRPGKLEPLSKVKASWAIIRAQTSTPSRMDLWPERILSVQQRAEKLPKPGHPAQEMSVEQTTFCTGLQRALGASNRRRWTGGMTPRPAGLREAARPDYVTPRVHPLRGSYDANILA